MVLGDALNASTTSRCDKIGENATMTSILSSDLTTTYFIPLSSIFRCLHGSIQCSA